MKLTSAIALMFSMWALIIWELGITQAAEPSQGNSFKEWCLQRTRLSVEHQKAVEVLMLNRKH